MKLNRTVALLAIISIASAAAVADDDIDPRAVIEARQHALREIGDAFKSINDQLKRSDPALPLIREKAGRIVELSKRQARWFPEGTGQDADVINAAKDEIWEKSGEFKAGQQAMSTEAAKFLQVAAGNDVSAIKNQARALGATCKRCHDSFREED